jgi:hypothetical protein
MPKLRKRSARFPLAALAQDVVRNWEHGDLAGAVNRLRAAAEELDGSRLAAMRQALRFALGRPREFALWLSSADAGVEEDLQALSPDAISELIYDLLNDNLGGIPALPTKS